MRNRQNIYFSAPFLLGLIILVLNDHFLKEYFHNNITGKLSDFAGLYIFPVFLYSIFKKRKTAIYGLAGILFIIWKTPLVNPIINTWNLSGIYNIQRIVDYSDLWALITLPISYYTNFNLFCLKTRSSFSPIIGLITIVVFCSTAGTHGKITSFDFQESMTVIESKLMDLDTLQNVEIINNTDPGGINRPGYLDCNLKLSNGNLIKYILHFTVDKNIGTHILMTLGLL